MTTFNNALLPAPPSNGLPLALSSGNQHFAAWSPPPGQAPAKAWSTAIVTPQEDDPTMEEILGSIQRMLDEQQPQQSEPVQLYPHSRAAPPAPPALAAPVSQHGALVPVSRAVAPVATRSNDDEPTMEEILASIRRISGEQ